MGQRTDGGRPPAVTPADVFDVFDAREDRGEPLTAREVADAVGCARRTALNQLDALDGDGLASKKVGGRARVWWVPLRDADTVAAEGSQPPPTDEPADGPTSPSADVSDGDVPAAVDDAIRALDLTEPQKATLDDRRDALRVAWRLVHDVGAGVERGDFSQVHETHPAGLGTFESWYDNFVSPTLRDLPGVEHDGSTRQPWKPTPLGGDE
jgi:hypothetical protein